MKRKNNNMKPNGAKRATTRTLRTICEGQRIYRQMEKALLSADPSISGTVSMNYAISKLIANYKLAMLHLDIDVDDYMKSMIEWWEYRLLHEDAAEKIPFAEFAAPSTENTPF
mgnify:CR=1 FL=1